MNASSSMSETEFQLRKLSIKYSDFFAYHQWTSEHKRWVELVFALVTKVSSKPDFQVRPAIEFLDDCGVLEIKELSEIPKVGTSLDFDCSLAHRIVETLSEPILTEDGDTIPAFDEIESKRILVVLHEAAKSLTQHYDGKVQLCLRKYGQKILDELCDKFLFGDLGDHEVKDAITCWLQNVANVPLYRRTEANKEFCEKLKISTEELVEEADRLDINIALLDDMIEQSIKDSKRD
jgi:hypothetical protein